MAQLILHHNGTYNLYSTSSDGPSFESALTLDQLTFVIRNEDGLNGLHDLEKRLARAHQTGCSGRTPGVDSLEKAIERFRDRDGARLSKEDFIKRYLTLREEEIAIPTGKHPHAEMLCAWAVGGHLQGLNPATSEWVDVPDVNVFSAGASYFKPNPLHPECGDWSWRIKP